MNIAAAMCSAGELFVFAKSLQAYFNKTKTAGFPRNSNAI